MQTKVQSISPKIAQTPIPLGDFDVMEDENTLVNRLYYAIPKFEDGQFNCSLYYEENTFRKEPNGDLTLVHSEYGVENLPKFELPRND